MEKIKIILKKADTIHLTFEGSMVRQVLKRDDKILLMIEDSGMTFVKY